MGLMMVIGRWKLEADAPETSLKVNFRAKIRIFSLLLRFVREICCGGYLRSGSLPMSCWSTPWLKLREGLSDGTKKSRVEYFPDVFGTWTLSSPSLSLIIY